MSQVSETLFDPADEAVQQCPYPHYERLRTEAPVHLVPGDALGRPGEDVYVVSRHADIVAVLRDWGTFSSRFGSPAALPSPQLLARLKEVDAHGWPNLSTMLTEDPPSHTRYRSLVSKAFTPRRVRELEPRIREICDELVDSFGDGGPIDFVRLFAVPLPVRAVAEILEVPDDQQDEFKAWADASVAAIGRAISDDERVEAQKLIVQQQHWFADQIEKRRVEPRDDFLTALSNARLGADDDVEGEPLSMAEMLSIIRQIQVAGSETTTSLLAEIMVLVGRAPEQWAALRADPAGRAAAVVEEGLRVSSPNQGLYRIATRDTEIAGVAIPRGATLWVSFGSADHDGEVFPDPERFDPDRDDLRAHVAFGIGIHHCLGAALARLEATIAVETLARRVESFTVVDEDQLRYGGSFMLRGLADLTLDVTMS